MSSREAQMQYDNTLMGILQNEGKIEPFLDVIFHFLYRQTDFFQHISQDGKYGLPPGHAEIFVCDTFKHYEKLADRDREKKAKVQKPLDEPPPALSQIRTAEMFTEPGVTSPETGEVRSIPVITACHADDPGRGAVHDTFSWTQTLSELDVKICVPKTVTKSNQLLVELKKTSLRISTKQDGEVLLEGTFSASISSAESVWMFLPRELVVQLNLQKGNEGWWDCLIEGEGKIDVSKLVPDPLDFTNMPQEEQQQLIRKMTHEEDLKRQGKPTQQQVEMIEHLKAGWNEKGSPFRGQPFDPSKISGLEHLKPSDLV